MHSKQPAYSTENSLSFPLLAASLPVTSQTEVTGNHHVGSLLIFKGPYSAGDRASKTSSSADVNCHVSGVNDNFAITGNIQFVSGSLLSA